MTSTLGFADPQALFDEPEYRVEGPLKVTGAARYTADVSMPGMLWLAYTRSARPHARILSVDTAAAKQVPGVHAVLTGADIGHVGLGRRLLDIEDVFAQAAHVFEHTFTTAREFQGFLEPRACVVWIDEQDRVRVINTNKSPAALRQQMAAALDMPEAQIVVDATFIGGDFGGKGLSIDEFACYFLARATGRPIKAVMNYVDELQASNSRHAAVLKLRTAVSTDGKFLAHQSEVLVDGGAYAAGKVSPNLVVPAHNTLSAYHVPVTRLDVKTVYTNSIPGGSMRAPGDPQSMFAGECHVDMIAQALGLDPIELRRRNALHDGQASVTGEQVR
ncbi:MAG: xanthine dehydrogenase family protein molybdopterin-binding subunit, partial [Chloroflexi bacterium]|nr:xanthine dehydrogenase family protein molybdopterin-binding subunit [Chloroflexota bacterium]